jgi:membrane-associated phospholipid phosphatase
MAAFISLFLSAILLGLSHYYGKDDFFLMLNGDLGPVADWFFRYFTYVGDGILWLIWLVVILLRKQKHLLPVILCSFLLTTVFTQFSKQFIYSHEIRPSETVKPLSAIHFVQGVEVFSFNSFPSGHTATAFTFAFLIALLVRRRDIMLLSIALALVVGYTRVYLAQHFPLDVGAGIIVAVLSVSISIRFQDWYEKRGNKG